MSAVVAFIFFLVVIGVALWVINSIIPMPNPIRQVINAVVGLLVLFYCLQFFGLIGGPFYHHPL
jgi:hypothetical protein